ncbi:MAG: ZIP family metal transporter [Dehalococcoidales bacterium]|nr:ZIP family metal transporter [Dehalococcoidales bacterium]
MVWLIVAIASLVGGLGSVQIIAAALALGVPLAWLRSMLALAVGTLLSIAFLGLIPESLTVLDAETALAVVLAAMLGFFVLEKVLIIHHCHGQECDAHNAAPVLVLVGDAFHNAIDGVAIGAAFVVSLPLGLATALAVALHEIPQEVGDYAVLLEGGFDVRRAVFWNSASSLTTLPMALLAYWTLSVAEAAVPYLLVVGAGAFIYVALADLVPMLHRRGSRTQGAMQIALVLLGVALIWLVETAL